MTLPRWFTVCMGTGIVSILLHSLPYNGAWLYWLSAIIFALNVLLFVAFNVISVLRYTVYPEIWPVMIRHPTQSLFLGAYSMGLSTIVCMLLV
jgi:tellurite resistance protein TehA-like permease